MRTVLVPHVVAGALRLGAPESHHLLRVICLPRGGSVRVTDGTGNEAHATLDDVLDGLACLTVGALTTAAPPPPCVVLLGMPKPALLEEAVTLGVECGATALWLVNAARSLPVAPRLDRLERVIDAALKQCRRADRPALSAFSSIDGAIRAAPPGARFLAAPGGASAAEAWSAAAPQRNGDAAYSLAIGPEGGWTPGEIDALLTAHFVTVNLGTAILRAPTAVAAGLSALNATRLR
ncbi:ribosomal RNA small subunit methyltransferase E [Deltaproteobacteria bacterium]|nr:ribosomal RNA small subunit methyltransferase E [Deltaproteobacteria bacterium]